MCRGAGKEKPQEIKSRCQQLKFSSSIDCVDQASEALKSWFLKSVTEKKKKINLLLLSSFWFWAALLSLEALLHQNVIFAYADGDLFSNTAFHTCNFSRGFKSSFENFVLLKNSKSLTWTCHSSLRVLIEILLGKICVQMDKTN